MQTLKQSLLSKLYLVKTLPKIDIELNCTKEDAMVALKQLSETSKLSITIYKNGNFEIYIKTFMRNRFITILTGIITEKDKKVLITTKYRYPLGVYVLMPFFFLMPVPMIILSIIIGNEQVFLIGIAAVIAIFSVLMILQKLGLHLDQSGRETILKELLTLKNSLGKDTP